MTKEKLSLENLGYSELASECYFYLSTYPFQKASTLAEALGAGRTHIYHALDELIESGLVQRLDRDGAVSRYSITNPSQSWSSIIHDIQQQSDQQLATAQTIVGKLQSTYNYTHGNPNVRFLEGIEGIKMLHTDILREKKDIYLMRSHLDAKNPAITDLIAEQMHRQATAGIQVRALVPRYTKPNRRNMKDEDAKFGIERRELPAAMFRLPSQITIYGSKLALTSYRHHISVSIIEHPDMADSQRALFELLWQQAPPYNG